MKKGYTFFMAIVCAMLIFSSCSIEKRHYRSGYHIEWKHKVKTVAVSQTEIKDVAMVEDFQLQKPKEMNLADQAFVSETRTIQKQEPRKHSIVKPKKIQRAAINNTFAENNIVSAPFRHNKPQQIYLAPVNKAISDDGRLVFGIVFLLLGLSPFAVLVYLGTGNPFSLDLALWAGGLVLLLIGIIVDSVGLMYAGWIFLLAAWIYAIVAMIKYG